MLGPPCGEGVKRLVRFGDDHDRLLAPDIEAASMLIRQGVFNDMVDGIFVSAGA